MLSDFIRNLVKTTIMVGVTIGIVVVNAYTALEHFIGATAAFELLGTDRKPLHTNGLVGPFLGAFIPEAILPEVLALTLSLGMWIVFAFLFHYLVAVCQLWVARGVARAQGNTELFQNASAQIWSHSLHAVLLLACIAPAVWWDLHLFTFRTVANANGLEDVETAGTLLNWAGITRESGGAYSTILAGTGAWGYLSVTAACCVLVELSAMKTGELFTRLLARVDSWFARMYEDTPEDRAFAEDDEVSDEGEQPVVLEDSEPPEADTVAEPTAVRTNVSGGATPDRSVPWPESPRFPDDAEPSSTLSAAFVSSDHVASPHSESATSSQPLQGSEGPLFTARPASTRKTAREPLAPVTPELEVIGSVDRVSLTAALRQLDRYVVDLPTGTVWSREYWNAVHGPIDNVAGESKIAESTRADELPSAP